MNRLGPTYRRIRRTVLARRRTLAALCAAAAVATGLQAASAPPPPTALVLTAAHDIPAGTIVRADDLRQTEYAPDSVPSGIMTSAADVVGRTTTGPMRAGEPLTDVRLLAGSFLDGYPGMVAAPVRIGDAGSVALLRVGDRVDIVAADPRGRTGAAVVAAHVSIIAIPRRTASSEEVPTAGLVSGGLVVVAVPEGTAEDLAASAVTGFLSVLIDR
jgi:Flp pilus assembly protein CpaB